MIDREDIKEGLTFIMPNSKIERKYQEASSCGATDICESNQYLTTLKTPDGRKYYVTPKGTFFEICGGLKLISSADKKDQHYACGGEYIKVRSDALGKEPLYISLNDVMRHGSYAKESEFLHHFLFRTEKPKNNGACSTFSAGNRSGGKRYSMEHYGFTSDPVGVLAKPSAFTEQPTGNADAFRDITNGMYDTFKAKNHDYGNSFAELFKECGMTYAYGHMAEKLKRVKSLMSDEAKVKGESMRDSLLDLANYAILTIMELDKKRSND